MLPTCLILIFLATSVHSEDPVRVFTEDGREVCFTDACLNTAQRILMYMDASTNPCDNFYQFTCGKLLKSKLPAGKISVSSFSQVQDAVTSQIRQMLERPVEPAEHESFKAAKRLYALCMNGEASRDVTPARTLLSSVGWPVLGNWSADQWTLQGEEARLQTLSLSGGGLFHIDLQPYSKAYGKPLISVGQPQLTRTFLRYRGPTRMEDTLELPHVQAYHNYMVDIAVMFGADRQTAEHQLRDSLLFELDLEKMLDAPRGRHRQYELMTVADLQGRAGWVDWPALLAAAVVPKSLGLSADDLVKVYEPGYLDRLRRLVVQYPKRTIANFMGWKVAERLSLMSNPEMIARRMQFEQEVGLPVKQSSVLCVEMVTGSKLDLVVSSMYVQKYMPDDKRVAVKEVTSNLREQMYDVLQSQDWTDDNTQTKALLKACRMHEYVGYPNELVNNKKMDEFYSGLNIDMAPNFMSAYIMVNSWMMEYGYQRLQKTDKNHWVWLGKAATAVNAFYSPEGNSLELAAAFLQPPIFTANLPKYLYYSTIGMVIGHEITHGFDNTGGEFDAEGKKRNWWDESSKMNFVQKSKCLLNQYSEYIEKNKNVSGGERFPYYRADNASLGEIIADNGGLKLAYLGYQKLSEQLEQPELLLPGLDKLTREQMFFISLGNMWCSLEDTKKVHSIIPPDGHPPPEFRINGVLQNFPQFSEAFNCKAESHMNPKEKCSVW